MKRAFNTPIRKQLNSYVDLDVYEMFKKHCINNNYLMTNVVQEIIINWLNAEGKKFPTANGRTTPIVHQSDALT